jgi:hypothetical protein
MLHASGRVEAVAVASSSGHTLILASVAGAMHSAMLGATQLTHLAAGVPGDQETEPSLVATREGFAAAWRRSHGGNEYLVFVRLDRDGALIGEEHAEQLDAGRPGASVAAADRGYALGYVTAGAVAVQLVNEQGAFDGPPTLLPGSAGAHGIFLTWMPPNYLATWVTETAERAAVTVGMMPGMSHDVHPLSALQVPTGHARARLVPAGDHFVMSLFSPSADGTGPNVFTTGFESTGVRLSDPQPLGEHAAEVAPALAYDGHATAVTWRETTGENATRDRWVKVNERGERQGDPRTVGGSEQTAGAPATPAIAWDGDSYVLVRGAADPETIAIHRFGPNGCDAR